MGNIPAHLRGRVALFSIHILFFQIPLRSSTDQFFGVFENPLRWDWHQPTLLNVSALADHIPMAMLRLALFTRVFVMNSRTITRNVLFLFRFCFGSDLRDGGLGLLGEKLTKSRYDWNLNDLVWVLGAIWDGVGTVYEAAWSIGWLFIAGGWGSDRGGGSFGDVIDWLTDWSLWLAVML